MTSPFKRKTPESLVAQVLGALASRGPLANNQIFFGNLVPEVGLEPTRAFGSLDFESSTSTNFITPAAIRAIIWKTVPGCQYD
jgi:hypothetical protein